jgi:hypothetical protein
VEVINSFEVKQTQYADDTPLQGALNDTKPLASFPSCFCEAHHWLDTNGLMMNPDKTEVIVIGSGACQPADGHVRTVELCYVNIKPSSNVRSQGITIDDTQSLF